MLLKQLRTFVAVINNRSFTRAAAQLFLTQSAVSQQMAALEEEVGSALFYRKGRSIEPTESATYLYREVKPLLEHLDNAIDKAAGISTAAVQRLCLYYRGDAVDPLVVPILDNLRSQRPDMTLRLLRSKKTGNTMASVRSGEADLALLKYDPAHMLPDMRYVPIGASHLTCVLPQGHPLAQQELIHPSDLAGERLVLLESRPDNVEGSRTFRNSLRYQWIHDKLKTLYPTGFIEAVDNITAATMVRAGYGITLIDSSQVASETGLAFVPYAENHIFEYGALYSAHNLNPCVLDFIDAVQRVYPEPVMFGPACAIEPLERFCSRYPNLVDTYTP